MKISKRVFALATAGVMALVVAGLLGGGTVHNAQALASVPPNTCANNTTVAPATTPSTITAGSPITCDYSTQLLTAGVTFALPPGVTGQIVVTVDQPAGAVITGVTPDAALPAGCTVTNGVPNPASFTITCVAPGPFVGPGATPVVILPAGTRFTVTVTVPTGYTGPLHSTATYSIITPNPAGGPTQAAICTTGATCNFVVAAPGVTPAVGSSMSFTIAQNSGPGQTITAVNGLPNGCAVTAGLGTNTVTVTCTNTGNALTGTGQLPAGTNIQLTLAPGGNCLAATPCGFLVTYPGAPVVTNYGQFAAFTATVVAGAPGPFVTGQMVQIALGCTTSNAANPATDINFPFNPTIPAFISTQQAAPFFPFGFNLLVPNAGIFCDAALIDNDATPLTVPQGNITYTTRGAAQILGASLTGSGLTTPGIVVGGNLSGQSTFTVACANTAGGAASSVNDGCQGSLGLFATGAAQFAGNAGFAGPGAIFTPTACASNTSCWIEPNPANGVYVGMLLGSTFPFIGGAAAGVSITATYTENPNLGNITATAGTVAIPFITPSYQMTITANPTTLPAGTTTPVPVAVAGTASPATSAITTAMFHNAYPLCASLSGSPFYVCPTAVSTTIGPFGTINGVPVVGNPNIVTFGPSLSSPYVAGSEPGVITTTTTLGYFTNGVAAASAGQVVSQHCGQAPGTSPFSIIPGINNFNPGGSNTFLNALQTGCISVTDQLAAGGSVGTATVCSTFIGDFTGATINASSNPCTTVQFVPGSPSDVLNTGCNEVITGPSLAANANAAAVLALVSSSFRVLSIWQYNNALHAFQALYFSTQGAPTDIASVGPNQSIFICGTGSGTFTVA